MSPVTDVGFLTIAPTIFFILNATGQIPLFLAILTHFDERHQQKIILRELTIALVILLLFTFFGDTILRVLGITRPIIAIAGGVLLFLISLSMIFPKSSEKASDKTLFQEPLIIPLAIPVIAGPGAISTVMLYSHETGNEFLVAAAVFAAWVPSLIILLLGSYIKQLLGEKGLIAVERLGGMLVCLISIQMLTDGLLNLVKDYFHM